MDTEGSYVIAKPRRSTVTLICGRINSTEDVKNVYDVRCK